MSLEVDHIDEITCCMHVGMLWYAVLSSSEGGGEGRKGEIEFAARKATCQFPAPDGQTDAVKIHKQERTQDMIMSLFDSSGDKRCSKLYRI